MGEFDDGLVVLPAVEACRLATLNDSLRDAVTWGDLLSSIKHDPVLMSDVCQRYEGELPDPSERFDPDEISGFVEGEWPKSPKEIMRGLAPGSIGALGTANRTLFGDDLVDIAPGQRSEVVRRLRQLGDPYVEDDDLISRASGAWRYG